MRLGKGPGLTSGHLLHPPLLDSSVSLPPGSPPGRSSGAHASAVRTKDPALPQAPSAEGSVCLPDRSGSFTSTVTWPSTLPSEAPSLAQPARTAGDGWSLWLSLAPAPLGLQSRPEALQARGKPAPRCGALARLWHHLGVGGGGRTLRLFCPSSRQVEGAKYLSSPRPRGPGQTPEERRGGKGTFPGQPPLSHTGQRGEHWGPGTVRWARVHAVIRRPGCRPRWRPRPGEAGKGSATFCPRPGGGAEVRACGA